MSMTSPALGLFRDLVDLPFRWLGLERAPLALTAPLTRTSPAAAPVQIRCGGEEVVVEPDRIERAFPHATDRLVLFVPDTAEDESSWARHLDQLGGSYPTRLASLLGWTPVHLVVDPTRRAGDLAIDVVATVQDLVDHWPLAVSRIALVGHGSGGLVLRAACGVDAFEGNSWLDLVSDVVALGTPHLVVPLAGLPVARQLEEEFAGITSEDRADPDLRPLPGARYAVVTERTRLHGSRIGGLIGDLLWWRRRIPTRPRRARELFPTASLHHVQTGELTLRNHPDVHQALLAWLA